MIFEKNKIYNVDCIDALEQIPEESIDCVFTDPPYGLKKKGIENDENLQLFYKILPKCYKILKQDSFLITFFSSKYLPLAFKNNPFDYFWQFILYCPCASVNSPIGFTKYMYCLIFKKGNPSVVKRCKDIFVDTPGKMIEPDEGYIDHPTPKPKHFIRKILRMFTKPHDLILDPFMGSGSTAVACKQINRNFIGFEINKSYIKLANERLKNKKLYSPEKIKN